MIDWLAALRATFSIVMLFALFGLMWLLAIGLEKWGWRAVVGYAAAGVMIWIWSSSYEEFAAEHRRRKVRASNPGDAASEG